MVNDGECRTTNVIYKATVIPSTGDVKTYIGMTDRENEFKARHAVHKSSFKHEHSATTLSKHIWSLKDKNINYNIQWEIIKRARAYKGKPSRCNLCLAEKICILRSTSNSLLNKRSELISKCRHENKFYASNNGRARNV